MLMSDFHENSSMDYQYVNSIGISVVLSVIEYTRFRIARMINPIENVLKDLMMLRQQCAGRVAVQPSNVSHRSRRNDSSKNLTKTNLKV